MRAGIILAFLMMVWAPVATQAQGVANGALPETRTSSVPDRKQHGLRGPVRSCVEETTYPGVTGSNGKTYPEHTVRQEMEFDLDGRLTSTRNRSGDSEWVSRYTYDSSGRPLKVTSGNKGEPDRETAYTYGGDGRLLKITDSKEPDRATTFHYDEQGRKTSTRTFPASDYRPDTGMAGSPFDVAANPNLPGGATVMIIFDDHDRPAEVRVRDDKGEMVTRAVRTYDAQGHVADEKQILDDPATIIPADVRAKIMDSARAETGATSEQLTQPLREQLSKLMGGRSGPYSTSFTYDNQGRVKETRRQIFSNEEKIETAYNDHGDKVSEITSAERTGTDKDTEGSPPPLPPYSEVHYSYQYDDRGNWTEQDVSYRSSPDGPLQPSTVIRRTITYY